MKATRKLIPAIAMLLISAVMMSTATFAWFSTSESVQVDGMYIQAKSQNTYLVINSTGTGFTAADTNLTMDVTTSSTAKSLIPAMAEVDASSNTITWQTGKSNSTSVSKPDGGVTYSPVGDTTSYVLEQTFYLSILDGFVPGNDLILTGFSVDGTGTTFRDAISVVLVAYDKDGNTIYKAHDYESKTADNTVLCEQINPKDVIKIVAYIYINGEHSSVTTQNTLETNALKEMQVTLTFGVS